MPAAGHGSWSPAWIAVISMKGRAGLIRLPDSQRGRGIVVDRLITDAGVMELSFVRLIDRRDIVADLHIVHPPNGITVRIRKMKLIEIADAMAFQKNVVDLDGDGIPEFFSLWRSGSQCTPADPGVALFRWSGRRYVDDRRDYAVMTTSGQTEPVEFPTPLVADGATKTYLLHIYRNRRMKVFIDDKLVAGNRPFRLDEGCHTIRVSAPSGPVGYVFVEERGRARNRPLG